MLEEYSIPTIHNIIKITSKIITTLTIVDSMIAQKAYSISMHPDHEAALALLNSWAADPT